MPEELAHFCGGGVRFWLGGNWTTVPCSVSDTGKFPTTSMSVTLYPDLRKEVLIPRDKATPSWITWFSELILRYLMLQG